MNPALLLCAPFGASILLAAKGRKGPGAAHLDRKHAEDFRSECTPELRDKLKRKISDKLRAVLPMEGERSQSVQNTGSTPVRSTISTLTLGYLLIVNHALI